MRSRTLTEVTDCVLAPCTACGACDYDVVDTRVYKKDDYQKAAPLPEPAPEPTTRTVVRMRFAKSDRALAVSHLETITVIARAARRAKLPMAYTQGFHPKPKIGFGLACPVGVASDAEYMDVELAGTHGADEIAKRLDRELPAGFRILEALLVDGSAPSLSASLAAVHYRAALPKGFAGDEIERRIAGFLSADSVKVSRDVPRQKKGRGRVVPARTKQIDLKSVVVSLSRSGEREVLFSLRAGAEGTARPGEVLAAVFGDGETPPQGVRVLKEAVTFQVPATPPKAQVEACAGAA
jgi:radical SAM-linked protein